MSTTSHVVIVTVGQDQVTASRDLSGEVNVLRFIREHADSCHLERRVWCFADLAHEPSGLAQRARNGRSIHAELPSCWTPCIGSPSSPYDT
jgi:hypothetical protein